MTTVPAGDRLPGPTRTDAVARWLASSPALRRRRFELLPVNGPGAPAGRPQGRRPGPSTSLNGLADLISSIATCGLLSPVLVEEEPADAGAPLRLIVAGERRVMSIRRGAVADPDNPHFATIPAIVCPGPLTEEERRSWQLIENLAREDLQPGELGAALLFERCAVLASELAKAGADVPAETFDEPDPVRRYQDLERLRARHPGTGAPWQVVLRRLGLQLTPRKARAVAKALTTLPRELSEEMDEHKVALYTRLQLLKVGTGHGDVAAELWQAVKQRGRPDLLSAAVRAHRAGITDPDSAADAAEIVRTAGNAARGAALRRPAAEHPAQVADTVAELAPSSSSRDAGDQVLPDDPTDDPTGADVQAGAPAADSGRAPAVQLPAAVPLATVNDALANLRDVVGHLAAGRQVPRFDAGSLRLLATQLLFHLDRGAGDPEEPSSPKELLAA
jgi:ParB family chromosome partitioning protein